MFLGSSSSIYCLALWGLEFHMHAAIKSNTKMSIGCGFDSLSLDQKDVIIFFPQGKVLCYQTFGSQRFCG
jgi:hypothetical protein